MKRLFTGSVSLLTCTVLSACNNQSLAVKPSVGCDFRPVAAQQASFSALSPGWLPNSDASSLSPLTKVPLDSVNMSASSVSNKVLVQEVQRFATETNTAGILVRFANCTDYPQQIEARTQFLDESGLPAEPVSGWQPIQLPPRAHAQYQEFSTNDRGAHRYLIDVREAY